MTQDIGDSSPLFQNFASLALLSVQLLILVLNPLIPNTRLAGAQVLLPRLMQIELGGSCIGLSEFTVPPHQLSPLLCVPVERCTVCVPPSSDLCLLHFPTVSRSTSGRWSEDVTQAGTQSGLLLGVVSCL